MHARIRRRVAHALLVPINRHTHVQLVQVYKSTHGTKFGRQRSCLVSNVIRAQRNYLSLLDRIFVEYTYHLFRGVFSNFSGIRLYIVYIVEIGIRVHGPRFGWVSTVVHTVKLELAQFAMD